MRTLVQVDTANCPFCMNEVRDRLLADPRVHEVHLSATAHCWEIDHSHEDASVITTLLRQRLRGWEVADNGEVVMVATTPEPTDRCAWHS